MAAPSSLIICPGVHATRWTQDFVAQLVGADRALAPRIHVSPVAPTLAWSGYPLRRWLTAAFPIPARSPLTFVAFSAGCVAAAAIAHYWGQQGGRVERVIALDGWGVPLGGPFPVQRLSHDFLTHLTTTGPAPNQAHFYGDPAVPHGHLWRYPAQVSGWMVPPRHPQGRGSSADRRPMTALDFLLRAVASEG